MNTTNERWIENSHDWQCKLEKTLNSHVFSNIVASYMDVAFAFPSSAPNPDSFDYPLIDHKQLKLWAETNGWQVQLVPELETEGEKCRSAVCFTRMP